jgi:hypothetical protein
MGGFAPFADYLADDYQLADRIGRLGLKIRLADCIVGTVLGPTRFADQLASEVRWMRAIRVSCPWRYFGLTLTFSTPWALIAAAVLRPWPLAAAAVGISLLLRWLVSARIAARLHRRIGLRDLLYLPIRDVLTAAVWCAGAIGRHITWRGERMELLRDGKLRPSAPTAPFPIAPPDPIGGLVRFIDRRLRQRQHIVEFSRDPECILRISRSHATRATVLRDGTRVDAGEPIVEIHLWNEHLPKMPRAGPTLAWAKLFSRRMDRSLRQLAAFVQRQPNLAHVRAVYGRTLFSMHSGLDTLRRLTAAYGFELHDAPARSGWTRRAHDFGENLLVWGLLWTFNRDAVGRSKLLRQRHEVWMSRRRLMLQHGTSAVPASVESVHAPPATGAVEPGGRHAA